MLLLCQTFVLVALLDLLFALFDTLLQVSGVLLHFLLGCLLASTKIVIVAELVIELVLELVLHRLLLKLDVAETSLLILLLLTLVLVQRLFVLLGLSFCDSLVSEELHPELALLLGHLVPEVDLLGRVLSFKFFPERSLLVLEGILDLQLKVSQEVLFRKSELLVGVLEGLLRHLVLKVFKLLALDLEVLLDGSRLSVFLIGVLAKEQLKHLLFLSELLHKQAGHALQELVTEVLVE